MRILPRFGQLINFGPIPNRHKPLESAQGRLALQTADAYVKTFNADKPPKDQAIRLMVPEVYRDRRDRSKTLDAVVVATGLHRTAIESLDKAWNALNSLNPQYAHPKGVEGLIPFYITVLNNPEDPKA